jgi:diaminohydroxyphosphoribosylaminopyrimidine deaminase / 5-amino-6-(5-phosphoribosylamino)uracil reductase
MTNDIDAYWLREAVELAKLCPPSDTAYAVGAIIVDGQGNEISRGYSRETHPTIHAEEAALDKATGDPRLTTATIYTSMEPCGERRSRPRTCAQLIVDVGIPRVVFAFAEPSLFVSEPVGQALLLAAGIELAQVDFSDDPRTRCSIRESRTQAR